MSISIVIFRKDLRLQDNLAMSECVKDKNTLPIFIWDPSEPIGGASQWWLSKSLESLEQELREFGTRLFIFKGPYEQTLLKIIKKVQPTSIYWNREYDPASVKHDKQIKTSLQKYDINIRSFNSSLLLEPWDGLKEDQSPYLVFTPFWNRNSINCNSA